jgi:2-C-methyl-D-erythritol 2,4-cyclodiphosphate synthase
MTMVKIGLGFDVHQLVEERKLVLGGVIIPHKKGLRGHSDADVLVHSVIDALLGAANLGDIGVWFPDTDESFRDISSLILLERVCGELNKLNWSVVNIDVVILAENPRLRPYIPEMRLRVAGSLKIQPEMVSIKATTTEKLGFVGREEGIASQAVVLLQRKGH